RDSGRVVEHPDGHVELLAALRVPHEAGDGRVHREDDPGIAAQVPEPCREVVVHPEALLEVDLARGVAALLQRLDRRPGPILRRHARRAEVNRSHAARLCLRRPAVRHPAVRHPFYIVTAMSKRPSRIDLLELDIDLRLADLWREAADISEW